MMWRSTTLGLLATGFLALAAVGDKSTRAATVDKPNILFIMVDDLGPEWIGAYGSQEMQTPNIDRLAETGMRFTRAYSMPQCTPTRVTLLTGTYPFRHGWVNHWDVPRWGAGCHFDPTHNLTFARVLKSAGYATAAAGKWQINDFRVQPDIMRRHGFDAWCMWTGYETGNPPSAERYWHPYVHTPRGSKTYEGRFGTDVFVDYLIDFMTRHREQPMLLYFPMALTHGPMTTTPLEPQAAGRARFPAMVRYMDHAVGRLVRALEELNLRKRTIVIFTTDNGTSRGISARMGGRLVRGGKGTLSESGARAPFIVNGPGLVPEGVVTDALTDFTDMLPTFAELARATLPTNITMDGYSIADLIRGRKSSAPRRWVLSMGFGPAKLTSAGVEGVKPFADRFVRDERHKLWIEDGKPTRLFDLDADPAEQRNLLQSTHPKVLAARQKLEAIVAKFPKRDARPKYDPTPPQPWDRKPSSDN